MLWTATTLAGPFLVRHGIDRGIKRHDAGALDAAVIGYVVVAVLAYVTYRAQVMLISRIGESFLRDLRIRVFDHLQRLSMPFYDREKAGVIVSRMTSDVDSLQELVQMGLLMFVSNGLLLAVSVVVLGGGVLEAPAALPHLRAGGHRRQHPVPAGLERRLPRRPRRHRLHPLRTSRRASPASGSCRPTAGRTWSPHRFRDRQPQPLRRPHALREDLGLVPAGHRAGRPAHHGDRRSGVGGWWVHTDALTIGTVTFFVLTLSNLFEPVQQLSQLFNIVQSAAAALDKLFALLDTPVDLAGAARAPSTCPSAGDIVVEGVGFAYAGGEPVLRDVDLHIAVGRPAGPGRARPGPASPRWPS